MSKGGKQNVIPTHIRNEVHQMLAGGIANDPCDAVSQLIEQAKYITNKKEKNQRLGDLDAASKGYKCKNVNKRKEYF